MSQKWDIGSRNIFFREENYIFGYLIIISFVKVNT